MPSEVMALEDGREVFWLLAGTAIISVSSGVGLVSAFQQKYLVVYACLLLFVSGYKIAQIGIHRNGESPELSSNVASWLRDQSFVDFLSFLGGSVFMTMGFVLLTQSIIKTSVFLSATAAVVMGAGYILTHWAINNTLV